MPHALPHARRDDAGRLGSSARRRGMKRILLLAPAPLAIPVPVTAQTMDHSNMPGMQMPRSEEHTSVLQSLMRKSYAVFCLKKKKNHDNRKLLKTNPTHYLYIRHKTRHLN